MLCCARLSEQTQQHQLSLRVHVVIIPVPDYRYTVYAKDLHTADLQGYCLSAKFSMPSPPGTTSPRADAARGTTVYITSTTNSSGSAQHARLGTREQALTRALA